MGARHLTHDFHIDICSVLPGGVSNHNRVHSLVLPLGTLKGEDTVSFGGFNMDSTVSLCDDLWERERAQLLNCAWVECPFSAFSLWIHWQFCC